VEADLMRVLVWRHQSILHAYGPFEDRERLLEWFNPRVAFIDPSKHEVRDFLLAHPDSSPPQAGGKSVFYHADQESDDRADKFVVVAVFSETMSMGFGPFLSRERAQAWFVGQGDKFGAAQTLILPLLVPVSAPVG